MQIRIPLKPMSVNEAYRGRRFTSNNYKKYQLDFSRLSPNPTVPMEGELIVLYVFNIKNYKQSDVGNFEKPLSDMLEKRGYFINDKQIKYTQLIKVKDSEPSFYAYIEPCTMQGVIKLQTIVQSLIPTGDA